MVTDTSDSDNHPLLQNPQSPLGSIFWSIDRSIYFPGKFSAGIQAVGNLSLPEFHRYGAIENHLFHFDDLSNPSCAG